MKRLVIACIISLAVLPGCGPKEGPNVTPVGHAQNVADKYIVALSDFQDGVEVGYRAGWLSKNNTFVVAEVLGVAFVTIHESPNGAKASALKAIDEIESKLKLSPELSKWVPYLSSVRIVVEAL